MATSQQLHSLPDATSTIFTKVLRTALVGFGVAIQLMTPTVGTATTTSAVVDTSPCCHNATASASGTGTVNPSTPVAVTSSDGDRGSTADATADYTGGVAAQLHTADGSPAPGRLFVLMATAGSDAAARVYETTPFTHDNGTAADAFESNVAAVEVVEKITGADIDPIELTTAPGGGRSAGITYAIAYLNIVSDGAFTGNIRVAATGVLGDDGYVQAINAINEKTVAAHLADADVLFTPSTPTAHHRDTYGARQVGELFRSRNTGNTLAEERKLDNYQDWGTDRPDGMDIVGVRHIADVAAYLCGTGSTYACEIQDLVADTIIDRSTTSAHDDTAQPTQEIEAPSQVR